MPITGPLYVANNLAEIAVNGAAAQRAAQQNIGLLRVAASNFAATGSTQADAAQIVADFTVVTTCPAGAGVLLANVFQQEIANRATNAVNTWPFVGGQIEAVGQNVAVSIAPGDSARFTQVAPGQFVQT
jgi:hypothetical protein